MNRLTKTSTIKLEGHHASFPVLDINRSRAFYEQVLKLKEIPRPETFTFPGAWYQAGNFQIHLIEAKDGDDVGSPPATINPLGRHMAFAVGDYAEMLAYLKGENLDVFETNEAMGQMWIKDPDGHILEFICLSDN